MSTGATRYGDREIARGMVEALRPALPAEAPPIARLAARDVAQLLGLTGLEAALVICTTHAGVSRPRDVHYLAERMARLADQAESEGSLVPFVAADLELRSLAAHLEDVEWEAPRLDVPEPTHSLLEQLAGLNLDSAAALDAVRVSAPVAGALRAALDWLSVDERARTTVQVQDSAADLTIRVTFANGLAAAGAVLASVDGSLGPAEDDRWVLRFPIASARASYLLLRQGHLGVALPWHAVAKLRMLPEKERAELAATTLAPVAATGETSSERPAALLAHGLRRAWFVADRIVWRIAADAEEGDIAAPLRGATQMVQVDGEHRYWIPDLAHLLSEVAPLAVPPPAPRPRPSLLLGAEYVQPLSAQAPVEAAPPVAAEVPAAVGTSLVEPAPNQHAVGAADPFAVLDELLPSIAPETPVDEAAMSMAESSVLEDTPVAGFTATVEVVRPDEVLEAHELASPLVEPESPELGQLPAPPPQAPPALEVDEPTRPRALVVDDSIVARIFLTRMLEQRGFRVVGGETAAELVTELESRPYAVVFVDVGLPDVKGRVHLEHVLDLRSHSREPFMVVALTRDAEDEDLARSAGAVLALRKPFETAALDQMLLKLPQLPEASL